MFATNHNKELEYIYNTVLNEMEAVLATDDAYLYFENVKNVIYLVDKHRTVHGACFELITQEKDLKILIDTIYREMIIEKNDCRLVKKLEHELCFTINEILDENDLYW